MGGQFQDPANKLRYSLKLEAVGDPDDFITEPSGYALDLLLSELLVELPTTAKITGPNGQRDVNVNLVTQWFADDEELFYN
jgi:hypothetical protein